MNNGGVTVEIVGGEKLGAFEDGIVRINWLLLTQDKYQLLLKLVINHEVNHLIYPDMEEVDIDELDIQDLDVMYLQGKDIAAIRSILTAMEAELEAGPLKTVLSKRLGLFRGYYSHLFCRIS